MCRALAYLGKPVLLDHLLYQPDSALVRQSYVPRMLNMLNLAGFGMRAWDRGSHMPDKPYCYGSTYLPFFDRNLKSLAEKVSADCVLAHVRGVAYSTEVDVSIANVHPFQFPGCAISLAHNGDLARLRDMKPRLAAHVRPGVAAHIRGTTDSEWIYALLVSQFEDPSRPPEADELVAAVSSTLDIIRRVRAECGIAQSSSVNLFIATGASVAAVRYCFDFGCYRTDDPSHLHEANLAFLSLWYTSGREFGHHDGEWKMVGGADTADSVMIASEPLTRDASTWLEVPEYAMLTATTDGGRPSIEVHYLD